MAFLCGQSDIADNIIKNSPAYLQNEKKLIVKAAAQAQKAADFILGIRFDEAPTAVAG